jgi:hypothetical protein
MTRAIACARIYERDDLVRRGVVSAEVMATTTVECCAKCRAEILITPKSLELLRLDPEFEAICKACAYSMMKKARP